MTTTDPYLHLALDPQDTSDDDSLIHVVCHLDITTAFCGTDVTNTPIVDDEDDDDILCIVCADISAHNHPACPLTGNPCNCPKPTHNDQPTR